MVLPLMPKATAIWLVENTRLTFDQIADFCGMHPLEVQGIADGDVATGIAGISPVASGLMSREMLEGAEKNPSIRLSLAGEAAHYIDTQKKKKGKYTPVARRQDKPDAISWLVKHHPELTDAQIGRLVGTTKTTIAAIRGRTHWNIQNIRPRDPVLLGLCLQTDLQAAIQKAGESKKKQEATAAPSLPENTATAAG